MATSACGSDSGQSQPRDGGNIDGYALQHYEKGSLCVGLSARTNSGNVATYGCATISPQPATFGSVIVVDKQPFVVGYGPQSVRSVETDAMTEALVSEPSDGHRYFAVRLNDVPTSQITVTLSDEDGSSSSLTVEPPDR